MNRISFTHSRLLELNEENCWRETTTTNRKQSVFCLCVCVFFNQSSAAVLEYLTCSDRKQRGSCTPVQPCSSSSSSSRLTLVLCVHQRRPPFHTTFIPGHHLNLCSAISAAAARLCVKFDLGHFHPPPPPAAAAAQHHSTSFALFALHHPLLHPLRGACWPLFL